MSTKAQSSVQYFKENHFVSISGVIPAALTDIYGTYATLKAMNFFSPDTTVGTGTHGVYGDTLMETLLTSYKETVEREIGLPLCPSYSYYRVYGSGSEITRRRLGPSNEITALLCLGHEYKVGVETSFSWKLFLSEKREGGEKVEAVRVKPGNMIIFRGNLLDHWREPFPISEGGWFAEVFLNYVVDDGAYKNICKFDGRKSLFSLPVNFELEKVQAIENLSQEEASESSPSSGVVKEYMEKWAKIKPLAPPLDMDRLGFNADDDITFTLISSGASKFPILLADNVYKDPDYVRDLGLEMSYDRGRASISLPMGELWELLCRSFAHLYGFSDELLKASAFPFFRYALERSPVEKPLSSSPFLEGFTFLNLPDDCKGGLSFYRHKEFDIEEFIYDANIVDVIFQLKENKLRGAKTTDLDQRFIKKLISMGLFSQYFTLLEEGTVDSYVQLGERAMGEKSQKDWEVVTSIEMKYNRLVCFPGFLMHSLDNPGGWDSKDKEEQRLRQRFFVSWPVNMGEKGKDDFRY
ncbi:MAG: hypothetical protein ACI9S8_001157 [Chlamydiales bacterium]|jgi:hypothetical protein